MLLNFPRGILGLTALRIALICPFIATAQTRTDSNSAAFIFGYYPKDNMRPLFDEGYRRHLQWHREKSDKLVWYAWYVIIGERLGLFIDGSFGTPFASFDSRVDPAGDAADFQQTTLPFAEPAFRTAYTLRPDLSTATPLEHQRPTKNMHVVHFDIRPGYEGHFENMLLAVKAYLQNTEDAPDYTWYEKAVGGTGPNFMVLVPFTRWSEYPETGFSLEKMIQQGYESKKAESLLEAIAVSVAYRQSEVWSYRADLSYFPGGND